MNKTELVKKLSQLLSQNETHANLLTHDSELYNHFQISKFS